MTNDTAIIDSPIARTPQDAAAVDTRTTQVFADEPSFEPAAHKDVPEYTQGESHTAGPAVTIGFGAAVREARALAEAYTKVASRLKADATPDPASPLHCLAENLYFVDAHVLRMRRAFDGHRRRRLPRCETAPCEPRVLSLARAMVRDSEVFDPSTVTRYVNGYQDASPLDLDELWMFADACSLALVGALVVLAQGLLANRGARPAPASSREMHRIVMSLRFVETANWHRLVDQMSVCERILASDPSGHYSRMDASTRNEYRLAVVRIARRSRRSESDVARAALACARTGSDSASSAASHIGYYLLDAGLPGLLTCLGARGSSARLQPLVSVPAFVATHLAAVVCLVLATTAFFHHRGAPPALALLLGTLLGLASRQQVSGLVIAAFARHRPRPLPKMDYRQGIPSSAATCVAVPCLLESPAGVDQLLTQLRDHHLRNRSPNLHFVLLTDFVDAPTQHAPEDAALLAQAAGGIARLNAEHPGHGGGPIFHLLHRPRVWNASESSWIGHERKRGKLAAFNRLLLHSDATPFTHIESPLPATRFRYVITLDADTCMPADTACKLVGAIDHPLNRPVFAPDGCRLEQGYAIIQPAMATMMPPGGATLYAALWGGRAGLDRYAQCRTDPYHELFGEGSFMGKGIYDVAAFERALAGRFPDNRILSHDLIEGCFARCTVAADIHLLEAYAPSYAADTDRRLRWLRGDWQLAAWAARYIPSASGKVRSDLSLLSRYKIVDNLLRGLAEPAALAAIVTSFLAPASSLCAAWILAAVLLAPAAWRTAGALGRRLLTTKKDVAHPHFVAAVLREPFMGLFRLACLPRAALDQLYTLALCAWRLLVSHRRLLAWRTFSQASRQRFNLIGWLPGIGVAVATALACTLVSPRSLPYALPWILIWCMAPVADALLGAPVRDRFPFIDGDDEAFLRMVARKTWTYFDETMNASSNWLAPDHFRERPTPTLATRTSPTNIGLGLLAVVAAHDLGFIGLDDAVFRIGACLRTVESLPRRRGHLYNWYDTRTLEPLEPRYVSTVDSGNFVGHLMIVRQFLRETHGSALSQRQRLHGLGDTVEHLLRICDELVEADFASLYDEGRALLHLGIRAGSERCDEGHYDMLASEARLTVYVAIARGQIPAEAWYSLGRLHTRGKGGTALLSWSGSMFEYLMPALVMPDTPGSLLAHAHRGAVARQVAEAMPGRPWGVSECGYAEHEPDGDYCYQAFGSPSLGLQPGLGRRAVIAPYATAMACVVDPREAARNLRRLQSLGLLSMYGFQEAIDFGPRDAEDDPRPVMEYMAHHQGMSLLGLAHALTRGRMHARFATDPELGAARTLLDERMPERCEVLRRM